MFRSDVARASALFAVCILAACGGHGANGVVPSGVPASTSSAPSKQSVSHLPQAGIPAALLQGNSAARLSAERSRRSGVQLPAVPPGTPSGLREIESVSASTSGSAKTLVLYDNSGQWGFLGELYALATANLAGHFGTVASEPIQSYVKGQLSNYAATMYIGSTYYDSSNDLIPAAFYADVAASSRPVMWMGNNIWNFANKIGPAAFEKKYGWDPTNSYYAPGGNVGTITQVSYKGQSLTRTIPAGQDGGVLHPSIMGAGYPAVTTLATAVDTSTSPATNVPWAIRSGNLTYVGEIPFDYVTESDRVIAAEDLLFDALAPSTAARHRALLRLEDISPNDDPAALKNVAQYLYSQHVAYGFNIIPMYLDPTGHYNNGTPQSISLAQVPQMVATIKYMLSHGGVMVDEGYTHQYAGSNANPYDGVSGDDAEFFRAHVDASNSVVWDGPVAEDSPAWATNRLDQALAAFNAAGLPAPKLWITPHYFATDTDYRAIATRFSARYERSIYYTGTLSGGAIDHSRYIGEFFPYVVKDAYGTKVVPENLGDYEPIAENNHPIRLASDLIHNAQLNLAVRDGIASFFYNPSYPLTPLSDTINGIRALGYTFVSPSSL